MTKAASLSLGLTLLIGTVTVGWSQTTPTDAAVNEAIRRQADTILLRQKLDAARSAEMRKDLAAAAKAYEDSYKLVQGIGDFTSPEAGATIAGLVGVQLELARQAQSRGDLEAAKTHATRVLKVDPKNEAGLAFMKQNDKLLAEQRGRRPGPDVVQQIPAIQNEKINAATLVQDGKLLLEMGKIDEAEAKLKQATAIAPENRAAFYYLSLVKEARYSEGERRREQSSKDGIVKVQQDWAPPTKQELYPVPNPYARNEQVYTGKGRQAIVAKLGRIQLDTVGPWDNLPLSEVVKVLSAEAKARDPEKVGLNFMVNPNVEATASFAGPQAVDPATGLPLAVAPVTPTTDAGIGETPIRINPALNGVRLADVLDAIITVAEKPIKFSITDYAIVFSLKGQELQPLYNRTFKVDPNTFYQGLESVGSMSVGNINTSGGGGSGGGGNSGGSSGGSGSSGGQGGGNAISVPRVFVSGGGQSGGQGGQGSGGGGSSGGIRYLTTTNGTDMASAAVRAFFTTLGVDLSFPKNVYFNDRLGLLLVRATLQDLDTIEAAIHVLNATPPQVNVKAKFVEISQDDTKALGFDWYVGNFWMNNGTIVGSGGSQPSLVGAPSSANPQGFFPGTSLGTTIPSSLADGLVTSGIGNSLNAPAVATFTGILTDPQFRVVIKALEKRGGVDVLSSTEVTTVSGRQAQMQNVELNTIVTGINQDSGQQSDQGTAAAGNGTTVQPAAPIFVTPQTQILPFGPVLDVIPYVSADGFTVQMTIIPTVTTFEGYDLVTASLFVPVAESGANSVASRLPLPKMRVRQVVTSAIVWDGQTVVLGGMISEEQLKFSDKVPVLGDLPLVGKLFRSEASSIKKKNLMIFVTPTIIDPAGNRWHSEDEMPFAQNAIPPQRPIAPVP